MKTAGRMSAISSSPTHQPEWVAVVDVDLECDQRRASCRIPSRTSPGRAAGTGRFGAARRELLSLVPVTDRGCDPPGTPRSCTFDRRPPPCGTKRGMWQTTTPTGATLVLRRDRDGMGRDCLSKRVEAATAERRSARRSASTSTAGHRRRSRSGSPSSSRSSTSAAG